MTNRPPTFLNSEPEDVKQQHMLKIGGKKDQTAPQTDPKIFEELSMINRRLKLLETGFANTRSKLENIENNEVENNKENRKDIRVLQQENDDINSILREIKENLKILITELKEKAQKQEVKTIQSYLDMWSPVQFVTANQARKLAKDVFEELQRKNL